MLLTGAEQIRQNRSVPKTAPDSPVSVRGAILYDVPPPDLLVEYATVGICADGII
jgi:hypothetical protein